MNITTIICLIVVALAAAGIIIYWYTHKPTEEQKKAAEDFLASLYEVIFETIKSAIGKKVIDGTEESVFYFDFELFKVDLLESLYDEVWAFVSNLINTSDMHAVLKRIITRENVETLVNTIVSTPEIEKLIDEHYTTEVAKAYSKMEEEDKKAIAEAVAAENISAEEDNFDDAEYNYSVEESHYPDSVDIDENDDTVEKLD